MNEPGACTYISEDVGLLALHGEDIAMAIARSVTDYANFLASA